MGDLHGKLFGLSDPEMASFVRVSCCLKEESLQGKKREFLSLNER